MGGAGGIKLPPRPKTAKEPDLTNLPGPVLSGPRERRKLPRKAISWADLLSLPVGYGGSLAKSLRDLVKPGGPRHPTARLSASGPPAVDLPPKESPAKEEDEDKDKGKEK